MSAQSEGNIFRMVSLLVSSVGILVKMESISLFKAVSAFLIFIK